MRVALLSLLSIAPAGCALLYDFEDGAGGAAAASSGASTTRDAATGTTAVSADGTSIVGTAGSTSSGSDPCVVGGDIAQLGDPFVVLADEPLAGRPGGVLLFGSRVAGQPVELLAVSRDLELAQASTEKSGYSRAAAFGPDGFFMSGPPSAAVQSCKIDGAAIGCLELTLVAPTGDLVDIGWGGTMSTDEWLLTMRKNAELITVYKTLTGTSAADPLATLVSDAQSGAPTGMSIHDVGQDGPGAGDALFARHGESVQRCELAASGCAAATVAPVVLAGMRDAAQRRADAGRDFYFVDGGGRVRTFRSSGDVVAFLDDGVDASLLATTRGRVFVVATVGSFARVLACADAPSASLAACQCAFLPAPAAQIAHVAADPAGTDVYLTTKDGALYRWAPAP